MCDDLSLPWQPDPDAAKELIALGRTGRARKQGCTFTPSVHARPLAGSVERGWSSPVHEDEGEKARAALAKLEGGSE